MFGVGTHIIKRESLIYEKGKRKRHILRPHLVKGGLSNKVVVIEP